MRKIEKKEVDVDADPCWTLKAWREFIDLMIDNYGEDAVLYTDAGANNVQLVIIQED